MSKETGGIDRGFATGQGSSNNTAGIGGGGGGWSPAPPRALDKQVGGDHYKKVGLQPVEVAWAWELDFPDGSILKYLFRWSQLRNVEDLEKLKHWAEMILEHAHTTPSGTPLVGQRPRS